MPVTKKAIVFPVVSWMSLLFAWLQGHSELRDAGVLAIVALFGPALAAIVCSTAFEKKVQLLKALGLGFRPNWWWLRTLLIPFGLTALMLLITTMFSPYKLVGMQEVAQRSSSTGRDLSSVV